ncbi:MAG: general secretion pathway protein GspK [Bdellovibrionales bacterium]|nr:general secretion pathway protein GspK [Bdellovibrionales bacterium]
MKIKILSPFFILKSNKAVALLLALFSLTMSIWVATEISYDSNVEYILASRKLQKLQAYYAAKSGANISLLRIFLFKKAVQTFASKADISTSSFEPIWSFPLAWPPSFYLPDKFSKSDKDSFITKEEESFIKAQYTTSISVEDNKIDINDMASPSKILSAFSFQQFINIFKLEIENNENFAKKYRDYNFTELANNFKDWIDKDSESLNGGDEKSFYNKWIDKYKLVQDDSEYIPPNQSFKHISELRMVSGMNDDFFQLLIDKITLFGSKKINLNHMDIDLLKSFPWATPEVVAAFEEKLSSQSFVNTEDFQTFLKEFELQEKVNTSIFSFDSGVNFQITSTGIVNNTSYTIKLITYDLNESKERLSEILFTERQEEIKKDEEDSQIDKNKEKYKKSNYFILNESPVVVHWQEF